ncbi:MAG TPA: hypothetical protein VJ717_16310 [Gemmatimonadaceae bacterium]|nr:hypothetical protein [Gemmatimonadaceae bacterium]
MPHISSCLPLAGPIGVAGAIGLTAWRMARRGDAAFRLGDALGAGAIGGVAALVIGVTACVLREGGEHPGGGGFFGSWFFRLLSFVGPGLVIGALLGAATAFAIAWVRSRRRRGV